MPTYFPYMAMCAWTLPKEMYRGHKIQSKYSVLSFMGTVCQITRWKELFGGISIYLYYESVGRLQPSAAMSLWKGLGNIQNENFNNQISVWYWFEEFEFLVYISLNCFVVYQPDMSFIKESLVSSTFTIQSIYTLIVMP